MLDIKLIRERPDFVRQRLATRGAGDEARIEEVLKLDEQRRKLLARGGDAQGPAQPRLQGNRRADGPEEAARRPRPGRRRRATWATASRSWTSRSPKWTATREQLDAAAAEPAARVGAGRARPRRTIRWSACRARSRSFAFKPKSHVELCESLRLVDFERARPSCPAAVSCFTRTGGRSWSGR